MTPTQDQIDRAHEWVVERYPDATHAEYETHLADALRDIVELDRAADAAAAGIEPAGVIFTNEPPIGEPEALRRKVYAKKGAKP